MDNKKFYVVGTLRGFYLNAIDGLVPLDKAKVFSDYNEAKNKAAELGLYAFNLMLISVTEEGY